MQPQPHECPNDHEVTLNYGGEIDQKQITTKHKKTRIFPYILGCTLGTEWPLYVLYPVIEF